MENNINIETNRLIIRPLMEKDADRFITMLSQEAVGIMLSRGRGSTVVEARNSFENMLIYNKKSNFGVCSILNKNSDEFIGYCGLRKLKVIDETELIYSYMEEYWGRGFATEAALEIIKYGNNLLRLRKIIGLTRRENLKSMRVLSKLDFKYMGVKNIFSFDCSYFEKKFE